VASGAQEPHNTVENLIDETVCLVDPAGPATLEGIMSQWLWMAIALGGISTDLLNQPVDAHRLFVVLGRMP
jgi:hypothetical protein